MEGKSHKIHVRGGPPECPLCQKQMREVIQRNKQPLVWTKGWSPITVFYVCVREGCMVWVRKGDPCIANWHKVNDPATAPKCQLCGKPMRVFVRSDKTVIMQCKDSSHRPYQIARGDVSGKPMQGG